MFKLTIALFCVTIGFAVGAPKPGYPYAGGVSHLVAAAPIAPIVHTVAHVPTAYAAAPIPHAAYPVATHFGHHVGHHFGPAVAAIGHHPHDGFLAADLAHQTYIL